MDQQYADYDSYGASADEYYGSAVGDAADATAGSSAGSDGAYAAEYWRLDEEAKICFYDLAPDAFGESVSLGDLDELCRRMGRPVRDDGEQLQLMTQLDTTNQMLILRHDFVSWLLQDLVAEQELVNVRLHERENRAVPVAEPAWEEIVLDSTDDESSSVASLMLEPTTPSKYFCNVVTGEAKWELPRFVQCLWDAIIAGEAKRATALNAAVATDPSQSPLLTDEHSPSNVEMLQDLRALFTKYDDDGSGTLDGTEFEDLCVAVGHSLSGSARELMREVDPFSAQEVVSWDAFSHYWVTNAPFQRRTRLDREGFAAWERVDVLHKKNLPVAFRNANTLVERWNHPQMEQNVVNLLLKLFPSTKLDWTKKIALFFQVQFEKNALANGGSEGAGGAGGCASSLWDLSQCARVLSQLNHPMSRRRHLETALQQLQGKFGDESSAGSRDGYAVNKPVHALDEMTVTNWFLYSIRKVEMRGWEEIVEPSSGQVYYYHEVSGLTRWDPPQMESQMSSFLGKFSGIGGGSNDERITRIFHHYDLDESGSISLDEFAKFYRALLGSTESGSSQADEIKIRQIFRVLDTGGDGSVNLDEFKLWWRTKLQLEEEETEDAKLQKRFTQRRELCRSFLENADALIIRVLPTGIETAPREDGAAHNELQPEPPSVCFESNLLPRLVAVLGKYQLKGLSYRNALNELVKDALNQEVRLEEFLIWYDAFDASEREKEEIEEAKAKAQAELRAQELKAITRAKEKQLKAKSKLKLSKQSQSQQNDDEARRKRIESLFKAFDANGSGFLDEKELQQLTKALGHEMNAAQVHQMMQVMDTSGDRQVSLDEFLTFWNAFQRAESLAKKPTSSSQPPPVPGYQPARANNARKAKGHRPSVMEASASLSVGLEMAKSRVLKFSLDDFKEALGDWKDELADKRSDKKKQQLADATALEQRRKWSSAFVPTKKRRYAHFDVTWIEPEVVECVVDMIHQITTQTRPLTRPDAAQSVQKIARGYVARSWVLQMVEARFHAHVDLRTRFLYFEDCETGKALLERPLHRASKMSTAAPFELEDCDSKLERYEFQKKQREMRAKQRFYEANRLVDANPFALLTKTPSSAISGEIQQHSRSLFLPAVFYSYDVSQLVHKRLLGDIWVPLRGQKEFVLIELIATRHRRQLKQRSSDGASYLPLHYVVRHAVFPLRVVRAIAAGYEDALRGSDAFGMTPLHLAFRERRSSMDLVRLLIGKAQSAPSIWTMKTRCGDTPLHVAVLHRAPVELMRWVLSSSLISIDAVCSLNARGDSPFHIAIRQFESATSSSSYSKAIVHTFFKHYDAARLCSLRTKHGDLPLHLAMDAFEEAKQRRQNQTASDSGSWVWLTRFLVTKYPQAVLTCKGDNGLLPIHLAIKYEFPAAFAREVWEWTLASVEESRRDSERQSVPSSSQGKAMVTALEWTMIAQTRTTLLHYAILYQPYASELVQSIVARMPEACSMKCAPNDDLPLHLAAASKTPSSSASADAPSAQILRVMRLLCEHYLAGCQVYNRQGKLPIHLAISSGQSVDALKILIQYSPFVLTANKQERNGLRALILAASAMNPDYAILSTLLELTPSAKLTLRDVRKRPVTPLYAISMRPCRLDGSKQDHEDAAARRSAVLTKFSTNFEQIEDEDAYFLEMAKTKMRRKHHCPTADWDYRRILHLMDLNPLDEAVIQRALLAINNKLLALFQAQSDGNQNDSSDSLPHDTQKGLGDAAVAAIALDPELLIIRRIHQFMYELPLNTHVQVMGQGILKKLLPTAFAKAAYKSKIDPYFNL